MRAVHADAVVTGDAAIRPRRRGRRRRRGHGGRRSGAAADVLPRHAGVAVERVRGVVLPGLVNAHTHLELSALRGRVPGGAGFVPWVEHMIGARAEVRPEEDADGDRRAPSTSSTRAGTVAVGEVTNSLAAVASLARRGFVGCVFHEVFGVEQRPARGARRRPAAHRRGARRRPGRARDLAYAPTPHTLYTTHPDVVRRLLRERARARRSHEPPPRRARGRAPLPRARRRPHRRLVRVAPQAAARSARVARAVARRPSPTSSARSAPTSSRVHLTDARPRSSSSSRDAAAPVVLCPRSNLLHRDAPAAAARRARRRASAPRSGPTRSRRTPRSTCSPRRARSPTASRRCPRDELLRMATWEGARALGRHGRRAHRARARARGSSPSTGDAGRTTLRLRPAQRPGAAAMDRPPRPWRLVMTRRSRASAPTARSSRSRTRSSRCPSPRARSCSRSRVPHAPLDAAGASPRCSPAWCARARARWPSTAGPTATSTRGTRARGAATSRRAPFDPGEALALAVGLGRRVPRRRRDARLLACASSRRRVLVVLLGYSYAKRFTWGAHAWLGVALALAPGGAWLAMGARPGSGIVLLMVAVVTGCSASTSSTRSRTRPSTATQGCTRSPRASARGARSPSAPAPTSSPSLALAGCGLALHRGPAYAVAVATAAALLVYEHALVRRRGLGRDRPGVLRRQRLGQRRLLRARAGRRARPPLSGRLTARALAFTAPMRRRFAVVLSLASSFVPAGAARGDPRPARTRVRLARDASSAPPTSGT